MQWENDLFQFFKTFQFAHQNGQITAQFLELDDKVQFIGYMCISKINALHNILAVS